MSADLSTWLTKAQAAAAIGVSTKAIERFTQAGKLEQAFRQQAGSPPVAVYFPDDVARIAAARQRGPQRGFLVPDQAPATSNGHGQPGRELADVTNSSLLNIASGEELLRVLVAAATHLVSQTSQMSALPETPWVDIPTAAAILGRSQAYVRRQITAGALHAERDRCLVVRRADLKGLR